MMIASKVLRNTGILRHSSTKGSVQVVLNGATFCARHKSTRARDSSVDVNGENCSSKPSHQEYLATWLGKDMAGESYHQRMVSAAARIKQEKISTKENSEQTSVPVPVALETKSIEIEEPAVIAQNSSVLLQTQGLSMPVVSLVCDHSSFEIEAVMADLDETIKTLDGQVCLLDLSLAVGCPTASQESLVSLFRAAIKKLESTSCAVLGAVGCSDESALLVADALTLRSIALQTGLLRKAQSVPVVETSRATSATLVHYGAVRSGQQLYAEGGSLVVVGSVNEGGEVMADGDIHVYGALRGRAVAGLGGSDGAHVFARRFDASLVGVSSAFVAPDDSEELRSFKDKEVCVRSIHREDKEYSRVISQAKTKGGVVIECGDDSSLVMTCLPATDEKPVADKEKGWW